MTSYRDAGVDLEGADRHTASIAGPVMSTWSTDVIGGFGGFAAGVRIPPGYQDPVLMLSTDGVGTKLELARQMARWDGVGFDLVAMCVDDLAATGARPIGFVDYLAVGSLQQDRDQAIVESIAAACLQANCPLLGGETAEHPGVMGRDAIDLAGAAAGLVETEAVLGPDRVERGDLIVGLRSPNLRSNGFSLVRSVLADSLAEHGTTLLDPSVIYSPAVMAAIDQGGVHAAAHITGGGLAANLARALPSGSRAIVDAMAWVRPAVFDLISDRGVAEEEMRKTFNLGIGFCLVVAPEAVGAVSAATAHHEPTVIGEIADGTGVELR